MIEFEFKLEFAALCDAQETFKSVGSLRMDFITLNYPNRQRGRAAGAQLM